MKEKKVSALRWERMRLGLTMQAVATRAGINYCSLANYEAGRLIPPERHKMILSKILGVPVKELFPREDHDRVLDR